MKTCKLNRTLNDEEIVVTIEYHIVYDVSYSVPKLCFNVYRTDGSMLNLDDCAKIFQFAGADDILGVFTQMDHPVLQMPIYTLHPCKTGSLLQIVSSQSKNVIVTWLSTVGPIVGLNVINEYAQLT